jgi:transposase
MLAKSCRRVQIVWTDGGYAGKLVIWAKETLNLALTIVKRSDDTTGFTVLPRRWVVERTLGLDRQAPTLRAGLRTAAGPPQSHGPLDNDQNHQQTLGQTGLGTGS